MYNSDLISQLRKVILMIFTFDFNHS